MKFWPFTHESKLYVINQKRLSSLFRMTDFQNGRFDAQILDKSEISEGLGYTVEP